MNEIDIYSELSLQDIEIAFAASKCLILRDGVSGLDEISSDNLAKTYPDQKVRGTCGVDPQSCCFSQLMNPTDRQMLPLWELKSKFLSGEVQYVNQVPLKFFDDFFTQVQLADSITAFLAKYPITGKNIWISGPSGSGSGFHVDLFDNLLIMMNGSKTVYLVAPQHSWDMSPSSKILCKCIMHPRDKIEQRLREKKSIVVAHLKIGDILMLPRGWWHYVVSDDSSISVNYWLRTPWKKQPNVYSFRQQFQYYLSNAVLFLRYMCTGFAPRYHYSPLADGTLLGINTWSYLSTL